MSTTSSGALRRNRRVFAAAAGAILILDLLATTAAGAHPAQFNAKRGSLHASHAFPRSDRKYVAPYTFFASLKRNAPGYATAHSTTRKLTVPKKWLGEKTEMPITASTKNRVRVRLARRPDESQAWVSLKAVKISITTYDLVLDLSKRRLYEFKAGRQVGSYPVGIGRPQTPTPTGRYFIASHANPTGPGYGLVMLETSAHSKVYKTFEGGSDAIIALHGPLTPQSNAAIGKNGTMISHGCIRMHDGQLIKVAYVPDGTPITIVA